MGPSYAHPQPFHLSGASWVPSVSHCRISSTSGCKSVTALQVLSIRNMWKQDTCHSRKEARNLCSLLNTYLMSSSLQSKRPLQWPTDSWQRVRRRQKHEEFSPQCLGLRYTCIARSHVLLMYNAYRYVHKSLFISPFFYTTNEHLVMFHSKFGLFIFN